MGNGVPNHGPWAHWQGGALASYTYFYHDQTVTGNATIEAPHLTIASYAALRSAAGQSHTAFLAAVALTSWAAFFASWQGIDLNHSRAAVLHTP